MIVEYPVATRDGEDMLGEQDSMRILDELGVAWIGKNAIEPIEQTELPIRFPQQQHSGIRPYHSVREVAQKIAACRPGTRNGRPVTLYHRDTS